MDRISRMVRMRRQSKRILIMRPKAQAASASPATCRKSSRRSRTSTCVLTRSNSSRLRKATGLRPCAIRRGGFIIGDCDVRLGDIAGAAFYIGRAQFEYWQDTQLIIDVVPGQGRMFSLGNGSGLRFLTRSRLFLRTRKLLHSYPSKRSVLRIVGISNSEANRPSSN
jgi:uncharacterized protein (DUF779 family)